MREQTPLAIALRRVRSLKGHTLNQMAAELRIDRMTLHRYETAQIIPSLSMLGKFSQIALQLGESELCQQLLLPISDALGTSAQDLQRLLSGRQAAA